MDKMKVKATSNAVPMEENSTRYITTDEPRDVAKSAYYLRRLMDGELVEVVDPLPMARRAKEEK